MWQLNLFLMTRVKIYTFYFSEKIRRDSLCESSVMQLIHIKCLALFSQKAEIKKIRIFSGAVVSGILRVNLVKSANIK